MNAVVRAEDEFDWRAPDYVAIFRERVERLNRIRQNPQQLPALRAYYREHIADWISDWGMTYSPVNVAKGQIPDMPFVLFPKQREWIEFTFKNWKDGKYGGTEKSRDVGLSWLAVAFSVALATLYDGISVGLGSFSEEKVDVRGNMGSLFEKARYYLRNLPAEFRFGYEEDSCSRERLLIFPGTSGSIFGEIGDQIGRGNRASIYFVDEAAYLVHDAIGDAALSKTTPCRQDLSSVRGMDNSFATRMHDGYSRKFTFHWRDNPLYSEEQYNEFLCQWGPVVTAQELNIDYQASVENVIIPAEHVQAAVDAHVKLSIAPSGIRYGALDVADLGRDMNAFAARHGPMLTYCVPWSGRGSDIAQTVEECFALCDRLELSGFDYDADGGMGAGIRAFATRISDRRRAQLLSAKEVGAFRGSGEVFNADDKHSGTDRTNKDMFQNFKAQSWYTLKKRFEETWYAVNGKDYDPDMLISLPSSLPQLPKLSMELSQPQWKYSANGKLMVDKTPDGKASPNMADAVMMLFAPRDGGINISDEILNYEPDLADAMYGD